MLRKIVDLEKSSVLLMCNVFTLLLIFFWVIPAFTLGYCLCVCVCVCALMSACCGALWCEGEHR